MSERVWDMNGVGKEKKGKGRRGRTRSHLLRSL